MPSVRYFACRLSLVSLAVLAACSTPPPPPPPTPPPPVVATVMPRPPMGAVEDMSLPDKGDDGQYLTPNRGVTNNTALWHVRMALNVAALVCHDANDLARSQYNRLLHVHQAALTEANAAVDRNYSYAYGRPGIAARERLNTVVYNFFSLPPVTKSFCPVAISVGGRMLAMPQGDLLPNAPALLAELEKPFKDFYAAYEDYLRRLAEWQSRFGATVTVVVSPTPLPTPPVPPGDAPPPSAMPSVSQAMEAYAAPPPADAAAGAATPPLGESTPLGESEPPVAAPMPVISAPAVPVAAPAAPALSGPPPVVRTIGPSARQGAPVAPAATPQLPTQPVPSDP